MMNQNKILHIARHAKSSWDLEDISDIDRPLTDKGIRKSYQVAEKIRHEYPAPELLVSSHAIRALHTAIIFASVFGISMDKIKISENIYNRQPEDILDLIKQTDNSITSLILFGHNPDFTDIVNTFAQKPVIDLPTSGIVTFEFKTESWKNIGVNNVISQINHFSGK